MDEFKKYTELDGGSIERWAKELDAKPKKPLSEDDAEMFFICVSREKDIERPDNPLFNEVVSGWNGAGIIHKRLQMHTFTMTKACKIFCGNLVDSPGKAVMMLNYIQYKCHLNNIKHVGMDAFCLKIIPFGWFSDEVLREAWDNQKYESPDGCLCNMLDNLEYMESIRDIQEV